MGKAVEKYRARFAATWNVTVEAELGSKSKLMPCAAKGCIWNICFGFHRGKWAEKMTKHLWFAIDNIRRSGIPLSLDSKKLLQLQRKTALLWKGIWKRKSAFVCLKPLLRSRECLILWYFNCSQSMVAADRHSSSQTGWDESTFITFYYEQRGAFIWRRLIEEKKKSRECKRNRRCVQRDSEKTRK